MLVLSIIFLDFMILVLRFCNSIRFSFTKDFDVEKLKVKKEINNNDAEAIVQSQLTVEKVINSSGKTETNNRHDDTFLSKLNQVIHPTMHEKGGMNKASNDSELVGRVMFLLF